MPSAPESSFRQRNPYVRAEPHPEPVGHLPPPGTGAHLEPLGWVSTGSTGDDLIPQRGAITLHLKGFTFRTAQPPTVLVDGQPILALWGTTVVPVAVGAHRIEIGYYNALSSRYVLAPFDFVVAPGQQVPIHYASPYGQALGAIGHQPQSHPGMWLFWTLMFLPITMVVLMFVLAIVLIAVA